jgi:hypothetical protein
MRGVEEYRNGRKGCQASRGGKDDSGEIPFSDNCAELSFRGRMPPEKSALAWDRSEKQIPRCARDDTLFHPVVSGANHPSSCVTVRLLNIFRLDTEGKDNIFRDCFD